MRKEGANILQIFDGNSIKANQTLEWKETQPWFWYLQIQHQGNAQNMEIQANFRYMQTCLNEEKKLKTAVQVWPHGRC